MYSSNSCTISSFSSVVAFGHSSCFACFFFVLKKLWLCFSTTLLLDAVAIFVLFRPFTQDASSADVLSKYCISASSEIVHVIEAIWAIDIVVKHIHYRFPLFLKIFVMPFAWTWHQSARIWCSCTTSTTMGLYGFYIINSHIIIIQCVNEKRFESII